MTIKTDLTFLVLRITRFNANEYMNITYLNWGERYQIIVEHRSCAHILSSCEIKA